jgi:ABC-2 type transport system permease protein
MKTTLRIAKLELNTLFYSPIAWFLAIVFLFQCGLAYTERLDRVLTNQNLGGQYLQYLNFSTAKVFGPPGGMFSFILSKVYLYLPLITMGLISREVSSGTIKLLFSSPIKVSQVVYGKFVAMMGYNLLLVLILAVFCVTGIINIRHADAGLVFSGLLGIYLLLCAYAAIGLFMSCLTAYQVVAAISTLVVFAMLDYVGTLWQGVDFVRNLTYFLSISGRTSHMLVGLIETKDVLYFLIIIFMFLAFSIIRLQSGRASWSGMYIAGRYIGVFVLALAIGYVSALPRFVGYFDTTVGDTETLTPNTQKVLSEIGDEPLEVDSYINLLDRRYWYGPPAARNQDVERWEPYLRFKPNIRFKYIYFFDTPYDRYDNLKRQYPGKSIPQIAQNFAKSFRADISDYKTPEQIQKIIDLRPEQNRYVMQLKFRGKTTFLRLFDDSYAFPYEAETTAALKRLTVKLPKIVFAEGEFERAVNKLGPRDFGVVANDIVFRYSLINQGFDVDTVSLANGWIPPDVAVLVIGDPRTNFSPAALAKIQQYIADGGNLLITGEPDKEAIINPILNPLGVQMMDGTLVQKSKDYSMDMVESFLTKTGARLSKDLEKDFEDSIGVNMIGAAGLSYNAGRSPFMIEPLLTTDSNDTWNKKGKLVLDSAAVLYTPADGDDHRSVATALALTRNIHGKEQRIIVTGDADFLTTAARDRYPNVNPVFCTQLFRWFTYGQFPIDASRPASKDNRVNITQTGMTGLKILFLGVLPGFLLLFAVIFLVRRKRK